MSITEWRGGLQRELAAAFPDWHATEQSLWELLAHHSSASHTAVLCGGCWELQPLAKGCTASRCYKGV